MAKKVILSLAAGLLASVLACATAQAAPVSFNISGASLAPGTGYGVDSSETSGATLLAVVFSTSGFVAQNFSLDPSSPNVQTFLLGTVDFQEPNSGGGINASETDNLGVTAHFVFIDALGGPQDLTAIGTATTGAVSDSFLDYTLTWTPVLVDFGTGGQFRISLADLSFSGTGSQNLNATITLLASPASPTAAPPAAAPEPATLLLLSSGLAGLGALAWRRRL